MLDVEDGEAFMGIVDKTEGTELRSSSVSLWKRDPNLVDTLDTGSNGKVSLHEIFDGMRDTASLRGESVRAQCSPSTRRLASPMTVHQGKHCVFLS